MWYYKNSFMSWMFPSYMANKINEIFQNPRQLPQRDVEKEFQETAKFNILSIPTENYVKNVDKYLKNKMRGPNLPPEIKVMEFLPEDKSKLRPVTILCAHGWEGRGTNFFKFFKPLTDAGFRVLAPDFPKHGMTVSEGSGLHLNSHSINCIINYIGGDFYILAHSLGNSTTAVTIYAANDEILKHIVGYVGIGIGNKFLDYMMNWANIVGLSNNSVDYYLDGNSEYLGIEVRTFSIGEQIGKMDIPMLIIHDENDKELPVAQAYEIEKYIKRKKYYVDGKEMPSLYITKGLGHRRIIRDDGIVKTVVDFIVNSLDDALNKK